MVANGGLRSPPAGNSTATVASDAAQRVGRQCGVMEWSAPLREWRPAITEERYMTPLTIVGIDLGKNFH